MAKKKKPPEANSRNIIKVMRNLDKQVNIKELYTIFQADKFTRKRMRKLMNELADQGRIFKSGKKYALADNIPHIQGILEVQRSGVGFVIPTERKSQDIYINSTDFGDAWHGDKVLVALLPFSRGRRPEGKILKVIERMQKQLPARIAGLMGGNLVRCRPLDNKIKADLAVDLMGIDPPPSRGEVVLVEVGEKMAKGLWAGQALQVIGNELDLRVQEQLVKTSQGILQKFSQACLRQAQDFPNTPEKNDLIGRKDLRSKQFVTIDGATAKDFDDAILVNKNGSGYILSVAIADVAHYVHQGSPLDSEALERGNSYYFPTSVEPMLPPALSNGLCSLNPDVPRLVMVAEIVFSAQGLPEKNDFYPAVIQSKARLTYEQVQSAMKDVSFEPEVKLQKVLPMLKIAWELAEKLQINRQQRGSIDFDLPESSIEFNDKGRVTSIVPRVRHFSHRLIEEFMIAANEAVAEFLNSKETPFLYRIHPDPDPERLDKLFALLANTELKEKLPSTRTPADLRNLLHAAQGSSVEFLVNRLLLRTMMQAQYAPSHFGHFGLASEYYCHFTSPIRRYADLVVHRALKETLQGQKPYSYAQLDQISSSINICERKAMQAEREMQKRGAVLYLRDKIGQEFEGVISSLAEFGFWVELQGVMAEGLVRLASLQDDYYFYLPDKQVIIGEMSGKKFILGQKIKVHLANVSLSQLEIDLSVA